MSVRNKYHVRDIMRGGGCNCSFKDDEGANCQEYNEIIDDVNNLENIVNETDNSFYDLIKSKEKVLPN